MFNWKFLSSAAPSHFCRTLWILPRSPLSFLSGVPRTARQMWPHQSRADGEDNFLRPADHAPLMRPLHTTRQHAQILLKASAAFWCVSPSSQLCVISKLGEDAVYPFLQAIDEYVKQEPDQVTTSG